ncbi:DUF6571 family protein [Streptomyces sp. NRRL S-350]|uniref:DUF6571 family protein n=1 Tax=Streptomyces sp. NRRL S-350 TaxID=1463902 RepID=UPI0004C0E4AA|nr:DUF6571 family protein [Streptomyces sp. NRRL S-350]
MTTFEDLKRDSFSGIQSEAEAFERRVRNWEFSSELTGDVITPLQASGWQGDAAERASVTITKVRNEIDAAFEEASGIAQALRDAHTELAGAKTDLEAALKKAADHALTVSSDGSRISWPAPTTAADKSDPEYATTYRQLADEVAGDIQKAVARAVAADVAAATALAGATGKDKTSFQPGPGRPEEQAKQAADILKLAGNVTDAQLDQLNKALKEHANDPRFTSAFYQDLGPDGFLKYYGQLAAASADKDGRRPQAISDLQKNLGTALATATNTCNYPRLSDEWEAALRRAGVARVDVWPAGGAQPFGYQVLSNILRTGTYDKHFLNPIAEHVTQLSKKDGVWSSDGWNVRDFNRLKFLGAPEGGLNPMAGVLEALGHNPQAAMAYFHDPATTYNIDGSVKAYNQKNDYFDLLTKSGGHSPLQDVWTGRTELYGHVEQAGATSLGHALEAATTGRAYDSQDPLTPHTPDEAALMKQVVDRFGNGDGPKSLRAGEPFACAAPSLGHMMAAYMGDVQVAMSPQDHTLTTYGAPVKMSTEDAAKLLGALGRNPEAFGTIAQAQQAYTAAHIQDVMLHRDVYGAQFDQAVNNAARSGGEVAGILTAARSDALVKEMHAQADAYNKSIDQNGMWGKAVWTATGGKVLAAIPGVGAGLSLPVNYFVDQLTSSYHITDVNTADPATHADVAGVGGPAGAAKQAVETAAQGTGLNPYQIEALSGGAANAVRDGANDSAGLFARAVNG